MIFDAIFRIVFRLKVFSDSHSIQEATLTQKTALIIRRPFFSSKTLNSNKNPPDMKKTPMNCKIMVCSIMSEKIVFMSGTHMNDTNVTVTSFRDERVSFMVDTKDAASVVIG